jgi:hypothetical protein
MGMSFLISKDFRDTFANYNFIRYQKKYQELRERNIMGRFM